MLDIPAGHGSLVNDPVMQYIWVVSPWFSDPMMQSVWVVSPWFSDSVMQSIWVVSMV